MIFLQAKDTDTANIRRMRHAIMGGTALAALSVAAPAVHAQDAAADVAPLEEVVVTAQRREQSAQDVGVALNVFSGAELIELGVKTVNDLEYFSPNFEVENQFGSGQPSFSLRGVGFRDYATNNAPTVGVYVDDVAYPVPVMTQGVMFDIERVEVLRGPQGTLYGRNTTGGAVKLISARPTEDFAAGMVVEAGRFGAVSAEGYVSGALSDSVRIRVSGIRNQGGAWQVNRETGEELGDKDIIAGRMILEWDVSNTIEATLNVHGFADNSDGLGLQLFNDSTAGPLAHDSQRETSFGASDAFATVVGIIPGQTPFRDNDGWGFNAQVKADLGAATLTYVGAYEQLDREEYLDFDALTQGAAGVYFTSDVEVITQELRLSGVAMDDKLNWVFGGYYAQERLDESYRSDFLTTFGLTVNTPYEQDVDTFAVFAHGDYAITDTWSIVAGLRFEDEERDLIGLGTFADQLGTLNFVNGTVDGTLEDRETGFSEVTGKVSINYQPTDDLLAYASYRRGIKSGGFTAYNSLAPEAIDPFEQEELNAFEVGMKSDWMDGRLRINAAAFYYDYQNQQLQDGIFSPAFQTAVGRIVNVPESEIYGFEVDLTYRPVEGLTIGQAFGFQEGEFVDFQGLDLAATAGAGAAIFIDRDGEDMGLPQISYQGYIDYDTSVSDRYSIGFRFDYSYRDEVLPPLLATNARTDFTVDDFWLASAQIKFYPTDGNWEIALWGRNIFNTDYDETRNFFVDGGIADVVAPGMVATYGLRLTLSY